MSKKQDAFYFENYISCAEYAVQAAQMLKDTLMNFKAKEMKKKLDEIHAIEHAADEKNHELMDRLARAFITPIEREDMLALSHNIDEVTDKIEEVLIRIYINGNARQYQRKLGRHVTEFVTKLKGTETFIRAECMDAAGRSAWSNPIWLDGSGEN